MHARGFTLVEVLNARGILAMMAIMTIGSLSEIDHASSAAHNEYERQSAARVSLVRLSRELEMAFLSDNYDTLRYRDPLTLFVGHDDDVLFTTFAHVRLYRDAKESDQSIVEFRLVSDPDHPGVRALYRRE